VLGAGVVVGRGTTMGNLTMTSVAHTG